MSQIHRGCWQVVVLIASGLVLAAALAVTVVRFRTLKPFTRTVAVVVVVYLALAFALELQAVLQERG